MISFVRLSVFEPSVFKFGTRQCLICQVVVGGRRLVDKTTWGVRTQLDVEERRVLSIKIVSDKAKILMVAVCRRL